MIFCWDEGRINLCKAGIQQRFLVAIVLPHQETKPLFSDKPHAHSEPWKGPFLMDQFPFQGLSQGILVFSMMGLIYLYLWPYIVSFPASFSLTACFDLTPCKQDIISQENRGDHNLDTLIFMKQTKGIYFSSFFPLRVSKCTLTYSSSAVRKSSQHQGRTKPAYCPFAVF